MPRQQRTPPKAAEAASEIMRLKRESRNRKMAKLDRTEHLDEIFAVLRKLAERDQRVAQAISNAWNDDSTLSYAENDKLLEGLKRLEERG